MISDGRTKQLFIIAGILPRRFVSEMTYTVSSGTLNSSIPYLFCLVTGFMGDFLSFIVVEHILFFHGALQFPVDIVFLFCIYTVVQKKRANFGGL